MLPNPYVILALLIGAIGLSFSSYRYGYSRAEDAVSARVAAAQVEAIDRANRDTEAATARTVAQAKAEAAARLSAATIRLKGERDAALKARPECARDQQSMELLQSALDSANGQQATSSPMPDSVRSTSPTR